MSNSLFSLAGKTALVTGASSGLGLADVQSGIHGPPSGDDAIATGWRA